MPVYEYRCENCSGVIFQTFASSPPDPAPSCPAHAVKLRRRYSFSTPKMDMGGFDPSLGQHFDSSTQRAEAIKRLSDERSAITGIVHDYISVHPADLPATSGVTLESTSRSTVSNRTDQREVIQWL